MSLKDFDDVRENLRRQNKKVILALHKFVFQSDAGRANRQRLRDFSGFLFDANDEQYAQLRNYVSENLTEEDLLAICMILGLNYEAPNKTLHIFKNLRHGNLLHDVERNHNGDNDENDDDSDIEENDQNEENVENTRAVPKAPRSNENMNWVPERAQSVATVQSEDYVDAASQLGASSPRYNTPKFVMNFRDVEDSVRCFDGESNLSVESWVQEFQEVAVMMDWSDLQMYVFAKKSLKGLAKLFIMGEKGISTWKKLKDALVDEFGNKVSSAQIHKELTDRKARKSETLHEYFYAMKEIAAQGNIEEQDLMQYVIDGINDVNSNKSMLYGANNWAEFKKKLRDYETYASKNKSQNSIERNNKNYTSDKAKKSAGTISSCFNCGSKGHRSAECPHKAKGAKCFNCGTFGHISKNCPSVKKDNAGIRLLHKEKDPAMKYVKFDETTISCLIDTGAAVNVLKESTHTHLKKPKLTPCDNVFTGFGSQNNKIKPSGYFDAEIEIDGEIFKLKFYVVPDECIDVPAVIGYPLCQQAEITFNVNGVTVQKPYEASIMHIAVDDQNELDIVVGEGVSSNNREIVENLVREYKPEKTMNANVTMKIVVSDETPICSRPRRLPFAERKIVEEKIEEWLRDGVIEESVSEFCSPVVLVNKKNGEKRLCIDYRRLNKIIVKDHYPTPLIEDQLDRLSQAKVFSSIDLKNGFFHVGVDEESRKYTAFITHSGEYQFCKVPFGLTNSPAVFQRYINAVFRDLIKRGIALPYMDDVIIPAQDEETAITYLKEVFDLCSRYGLEINFKKCQFITRRIEFLGYVIEDGTIAPSTAKVKALVEFAIPENLKQLESFIGLASYFRKFIPRFSVIAKPLTDLRKKDKQYEIGKEQLEAINQLKTLMTQKPLLKIYDERHATELHTDASVDGFGAILLQKSPEDDQLHPVYYFSKKTTDQQRRYTSYELEILAVIEALKKFRVYLLGKHFKIITDCDAFAKTMQKQDLCTRVARWLMVLQEYDYEIQHRSGTMMRHVDALSRFPVRTLTEEKLLSKIKRSQLDDESLMPIFEILKTRDSYENHYMKSGVLYKVVDDRDKIVIPKNMRLELIKKIHEKGHFGLKKTKELIEKDYFIPQLDEKIKDVVSSCIPCLLINRKQGKQEGELCPLPKPDVPLHTYHADFVGPLETTSKLYNHLLVIVDAFTKFCWIYPTKTTSSACAIAKFRLQSVSFGNPYVIITDRGAGFTSHEFEEYCNSENIKHIKVTTGLPRANGQVERMNAIIAAVLAKTSASEPNKWYKHVETVQRFINSSVNRSTSLSPFELLVGVKMRNKEDVEIKRLIEEEMALVFNEERDELRRLAKQQIMATQEENKRTYNLRRKQAVSYKEGDVVAIKRTQFGGGLKLKPKYLGPYVVAKVKPNNTYDVVKTGGHEGPTKTSTCAEYIKPWPDSGFEAN